MVRSLGRAPLADRAGIAIRDRAWLAQSAVGLPTSESTALLRRLDPLVDALGGYLMVRHTPAPLTAGLQVHLSITDRTSATSHNSIAQQNISIR